MKNLIRVIKISGTLVLVVTIAFLLIVAVDALNGSIISDIASRVPILKHFVVKTFPTYLYGKTSVDEGLLKVARYDIDFLASFSGKNGRYVALYPFRVEAEIPLDKIAQKTGTKTLIVPPPEYVSSIDPDKASSMVFMNTLDLDYNQMLSPVLAMYHEKSIDLALEDREFTDSCKMKAESCIADLLGKTDIEWAAKNFNAPSETASRCLPVTFRHEGDNGRTSYEAGASIRDAFLIKSTRFGASGLAEFRFGRAGYMTATFDEFAARANQKSHIMFRYHDPMNEEDVTFSSFADEGYRNAFVYLRGSTDVLYVEAIKKREINDEAFARNVAPALLYLAASARPSVSISECAAQYDAYYQNYETALGELKAKRYGRQLSLALEQLDRISREKCNRDADDAKIVRKIANLKDDKENLLALLFGTDRAAAERSLPGESELGGNIEALFWTMKQEIGLTAQEATEYKRDLLSKGTAINREFVESVTPGERNTLYANFFASHLPETKAHTIYTDENGTEETWFYYGKAATEWKEKNTQKKVAEKLAANGMERGNKFIFVFSEPEDKAGFFTRYNALVLDGEKIAYYRNLARWLTFLGKPVSAAFADVAIIDGSFTIQQSTVSGHPEITKILKILSDAFTSDGYNRNRVVELLSGNLEKEAIAHLERPSLE